MAVLVLALGYNRRPEVHTRLCPVRRPEAVPNHHRHPPEVCRPEVVPSRPLRRHPEDIRHHRNRLGSCTPSCCRKEPEATSVGESM
jgi:hypothetical protein